MYIKEASVVHGCCYHVDLLVLEALSPYSIYSGRGWKRHLHLSPLKLNSAASKLSKLVYSSDLYIFPTDLASPVLTHVDVGDRGGP